jgi:hypothetical protein
VPGTLPLAVTSPADGSSVTGTAVTVTGTTAPRAHVDAEAAGTTGGAAGVAATRSDSAGHFSLSLPVSFGTTTITVSATRGASTAYARRISSPGHSI